MTNQDLNVSGIYKITNNINGKFYIGLSKNIKNRWSGHKSRFKSESRKDIKLYIAFKKYGLENFSISVLQKCKLSELNEMESYWCKKLNPHYNIGKVGNVDFGYKVKNSTILAKKKTWKKNYDLGINRIWNKGIPVSDEVKLKISKTTKKKNNHKYGAKARSKPIICLDTGKIYPSMRQAAKDNNVGISSMTTYFKESWSHLKGKNYKMVKYD